MTQSLLEDHRVGERPRGGGRGERERIAVRPDHVVVEGHDAALTLQLFGGLECRRFACDLVLACGGPGTWPRIGLAAERTSLEELSRRFGALHARAGGGPCHQVYVAHFAAPGRIVLGTDPKLSAAGALGTLSLTAGPAEVAAALAGTPLELTVPDVIEVRLRGIPPSWVGGDDVVLELRRRLALEPPRGAILEFRVLEPAALPTMARIAVARESRSLGAEAALFESDEATHRFLKAQGREPDWRALAAEAPAMGGRGMDLELSDLEPRIEQPDGGVVALREMAGNRVDAIWFGPELTHVDLARIAEVLGRRPSDRQVALTVSIGSRQTHASAARDGVITLLREAGIRVRADGEANPPPVPAGGGLQLACGAGSATRIAPGSRPWHAAGVHTCLAVALSGCIVDPRGLDAPVVDEEGEPAAGERIPRRAAPQTNGGAEATPLARAFGTPIESPLRGAVLLKLGDRVGVDRVLPWGARVEPHRLDVEALARFAFAGTDREFGARALARGGGWIVAGERFGGGIAREQVGLVAARLGLRGMLARSFAPEFRRQLFRHGVLAIRFVAPGDYDDIETGDELEIPDLPEGLEPGKPLVVRNLTRGAQYTLHHDLEAGAIAEVRAGGLLMATRGRARQSVAAADARLVATDGRQ